MWASVKGYLEIVRTLRKNGADVGAHNMVRIQMMMTIIIVLSMLMMMMMMMMIIINDGIKIIVDIIVYTRRIAFYLCVICDMPRP